MVKNRVFCVRRLHQGGLKSYSPLNASINRLCHGFGAETMGMGTNLDCHIPLPCPLSLPIQCSQYSEGFAPRVLGIQGNRFDRFPYFSSMLILIAVFESGSLI